MTQTKPSRSNQQEAASQPDRRSQRQMYARNWFFQTRRTRRAAHPILVPSRAKV